MAVGASHSLVYIMDFIGVNFMHLEPVSPRWDPVQGIFFKGPTLPELTLRTRRRSRQ